MLPTAGSVQAGPTLPMAGSVTSAWQHQGCGCKGGGFAFPLGMLWWEGWAVLALGSPTAE